jgi:exopolysaccharide biosynthesis polyprenyl glycosylphosphotransferase
MIAMEVIALVDMLRIGQAFHSSFEGLSQNDSSLEAVFLDPLTRFWTEGSAALFLAAMTALWAVRRARVRVLPRVDTTESNAVGWRSVYMRRLLVTDAVVILWSLVGAQVFWLGSGKSGAAIMHTSWISYGWIGLAIAVGWVGALQLNGARDPLVYGEGAAEYGRVVSASVVWFGVLAIVAVLLKADLARGYVLMSLPAGTLGLLFSRWVWREWLLIKRRQGLYSIRAVVIGDAQNVGVVVKELSRQRSPGYRIEAIALDDPATATDYLRALRVPIVSTDRAVEIMRQTLSDSIIAAGGEGIGAEQLRSLSWDLESSENLILTPMLLDIAGPRLSTRPVAGLNLIHVDMPQFAGPEAALKRALDILLSGLGLLVLVIPFGGLAAAIKLDSRGPVLYRQERVGLHGGRFRIWKFRSMVIGAHQSQRQLKEEQAVAEEPSSEPGNEVLFKLKDDPRVTRLGGWMRRWSVDELPQLVNVLLGSMSLVGPRPPLPSEVASYTREQVERRFLVKPGITGLWQVSGRSDLSWEESIRLDLYYVQNWSLVGDLQLLFRTVRVVLTGRGAY